jgi:predicted phosphoribosyltransferase
MEEFSDRADAGRRLASAVAAALEEAGRGPPWRRLRRPPVVLGLPRGGVPVAAEVADALDAPLDVLVVRKLGVPGHAELAFGAIASGGAQVLNPDVLAAAQLDDADVARVVAAETRELTRRERAYRGDRPPRPVRDRTAIVVDDGLATGATMRAAVLALRTLGVARIVAAAPVGSEEACALVAGEADVVVCLQVPRRFRAVGAWYADFAPTDDATVTALLGGSPIR